MSSVQDVQGLPRGVAQQALSIMVISILLGVGLLCQSVLLVGGEELATYYTLEFFAVFAFLGLSAIWVDKTIINPYLFLLATTLLFVGGRFIAHPITEAAIFSDLNFSPIVLSAEEASALVGKVLGGLLFIHAGYCFIRWHERKGTLRLPHQAPLPDFTLPAVVLLAVSTAVSVYGIILHYTACSQLGYMSIYQDQQSDNLTRFASIGQYGLLLAMGLAFATPRKWLQMLSFGLVTAYFMAYLGLGLRSGFLALMLMGLWLVHTRFKRLNIFTVILVPVVMFAVAQLSITVGCRAQSIAAADEASSRLEQQDSKLSERASDQPELKSGTPSLSNTLPPVSAQVEALDSHLAEAARQENELSEAPLPVVTGPSTLELFKQRLRLEELAWFCYFQGSSLVYSGAAMRLDHFPAEAYFQSFIPGFSQINARLHPDTPVSDYYFPHYLAKTFSEEKYNQGFGIGWSMFSDFHALSFGSLIGYVLVAFVFGALLSYFFIAAETSALFLGALVCVFLKLMLLPRSGVYSVLPYIVVYALLYVMIRFAYKFTPERLRRVVMWR